MVGTGEDYFPQPFISFSSFRPGTTTFEDFEFLLGVKESMFLLLSLPGLLSVIHTMFRLMTIHPLGQVLDNFPRNLCPDSKHGVDSTDSKHVISCTEETHIREIATRTCFL